MNALKEKLVQKKIAKWLVNTGYKNTLEGNFHISFEETAEKFQLPLNWIKQNKQNIAAYIDNNKKILSPTWLEEDFDMNFCIKENDYENL